MKNNSSKKSISLIQYLISLLCVAIIAVGGTFIVLDKQVKKIQSEKSTTSDTTSATFSQIESVYNEIITNYAGDVDKDKLIDGALTGMVSALDDPYSSYMSGSDADSLNDTISGSFEGIGATLTLENELPVISQAPIKDSPAEKAKLKTNDILLKVDGKTTKGQTLTEVVTKVRGEKGTKVKLTIQRGSETFDVTLTRDTIPVDSVFGSIDSENPTIGDIKITTFQESTFAELKKSIKKLRSEGAKSFVLDVRQNPGGLLDQVEKMASMFLDDGQVIVQFEDKAGQKQVTKASSALDGGMKVTEPVVVLVDDGSASASEIFAAALSESGDAKLIGKKTYGKGTVQTILNVSKDSELKLTIMKWLTPKGEWIHKKGIKPAIEADYPDYAYLTPIDQTKEYKEGDTGTTIKTINSMLKALNYLTIDASDSYSVETKAAVQAFQEKNSLTSTGVVNAQTASAIEAQLTKLIQENDNAYKAGIKELTK